MAQALGLSILSRIGISRKTHNMNMASPDARLELHPGCNNAQQISARHKKKRWWYRPCEQVADIFGKPTCIPP